MSILGGPLSLEKKRRGKIHPKAHNKSQSEFQNPGQNPHCKDLTLSTSLRTLLCALSKKLLWNFSLNFPGDMALKNGGDFGEFQWSPSPRKSSAKTPQKVRGKIGAKFRAQFGPEIRQFGELSSCNFSGFSVRCCFTPPSVRNLQGHFYSILSIFPVFSRII